MNMRERDTHIIILDDGQHEIFTTVLASEDLGYYVLSTDKRISPLKGTKSCIYLKCESTPLQASEYELLGRD